MLNVVGNARLPLAQCGAREARHQRHQECAHATTAPEADSASNFHVVIFHLNVSAFKLIERLSTEWFTKSSMSYFRDSGAGSTSILDRGFGPILTLQGEHPTRIFRRELAHH